MKHILVILILLVNSLVAIDYKPIILDPTYQHDKWDIQPKDKVKKFRAYTVSFDGKDQNKMTGQPEWVAYHIKKSPELAKSPKRPYKWIEDEDLKYVAPDDKTYLHSGYSRGHMCMKHIAWRLGVNADWNTHTTLNACPQNQKFNAGIWLDLEVKTEKWADKFGEIWVICGPAWEYIDVKDETKFIGDEGEMKIPIPKYFWKIVVREINGEIDTLCFIYPHKEIAKKQSGKNKYSHEDYAISINTLEKLTGLNFFKSLSKEKQDLIESKNNKVIWKW